MTRLSSLGLLLLLVHLLSRVQGAEAEAEPTFHARGSVVEMGYCFGVDYMVVFKSTPLGERLLGNSSSSSSSFSSSSSATLSAPAALEGRIRISRHQDPLGLRIKNLTHADSGLYRRQCWQNQTLVSQHTQQLLVCDEEVEPTDVVVLDQDGRAEFRCSSSSADLEGASVRWYHESFPSYRVELLLDTSESLEPLRELPGAVQVQQGGRVLSLDQGALKANQNYYCVVVRDARCLRFHTVHVPDDGESTEIFASEGDAVVLKCPAEGSEQQWETPLGLLNSSSGTQSHMRVSFEEESGDFFFFLVISTVSEEHSGKYSCLSSSLEMRFSLVLCPRKPPQDRVVFLGHDASLDCDVAEGATARVRWYRLGPSGGSQLIRDSGDETIALPRDLRGRLTLSANGSSTMRMSRVAEGDLGTYWCVVVEAPPFFDADEHYAGDYAADSSGEGEGEGDYTYYTYAHHWPDSLRCVFKQETLLSLVPDQRNATLTPAARDPEMNAKPPPAAESNVRTYAVGAGLVCLLVVWAIAMAIIVKRRKSVSGSGPGSAEDVKSDVDPDCTRRLTDNHEHHV